MIELIEAIKILRSLASGENPDTGQLLAADSVLEQPKVIRALHRVLQELEGEERTQLRQMRKEERREAEARRQDGRLPRKAGQRWHAGEEERLITLWDQGATVDEISEQMQRGAGGIASRLLRLGKVPDRETARARGPKDSG
jgi:hypothetical protein